MRNRSLFLVLVLLILAIDALQAQITVVSIDPDFGNGGTVEVNLSGFDDHITSAYTFKNEPIHVCGKIGTANAGIYHLGMIRLDSGGKFDPSFGVGGKSVYSWTVSDYPNSLQLLDKGYILCGASGTSGDEADKVPAVYRFKSNGTPDSGFGFKGRYTHEFEALSSGEATDIYLADTGYIVCGVSHKKNGAGVDGFSVMRVNQGGALASNFGTGGISVIPSLVRSVRGFFLNDRSTVMCGVSNNQSDSAAPELLLARFAQDGTPDPAVGKNGLIHTGIFLASGSNIQVGAESDEKLIIVVPLSGSVSEKSVTVLRIDELGKIDSSYGAFGFGKATFSDKVKLYGVTIANDGSAFVNGEAFRSQGISVFARFNDTTGAPDPIFNYTGIFTIDVDAGQYENYLSYFKPVGKVNGAKKYVAAGGSIHNGKEFFQITRFRGLPPSGVSESLKVLRTSSIAIYPDPVANTFTVSAPTNTEIRSIIIRDAVGREVLRKNFSIDARQSEMLSLDGSTLANGVYFCIADCGYKWYIQKFVVSH